MKRIDRVFSYERLQTSITPTSERFEEEKASERSCIGSAALGRSMVGVGFRMN